MASVATAMTARAAPFMTHAVTGSPSTCAEQMEHFMRQCALDGLMLIFADYNEPASGQQILPRLRKAFSRTLKDWITPPAPRCC